MPTYNDAYRALAACWEIHERLVYHTGANRMLAGLTFNTNIEKEVRGEDDLPVLEPFTVVWEEGIHPGAPRSTSTPANKNSPIDLSLVVKYQYSFSRRAGFIRRDPTSATEPLGMLEWMAKIADAIETTRDGADTADAGIMDLVGRPVVCRWEEGEPSELAFQGLLELTINAKPYCRAERSGRYGGELEDDDDTEPDPDPDPEP